MLLLVLGTYLTPFYAGTVGIKLAVLGATLSSLRLIDVGFDFVLGWIMDRFETPFGRFKPWFVLSLPVFILGVYKLLNPPEGAGLEHLVPWLLVCYLAYSLLASATRPGAPTWPATTRSARGSSAGPRRSR